MSMVAKSVAEMVASWDYMRVELMDYYLEKNWVERMVEYLVVLMETY